MLPTQPSSVPNLLAQSDAGPPMAGAPSAPTTLSPGGTLPAPVSYTHLTLPTKA